MRNNSGWKVGTRVEEFPKFVFLFFSLLSQAFRDSSPVKQTSKLVRRKCDSSGGAVRTAGKKLSPEKVKKEIC